MAKSAANFRVPTDRDALAAWLNNKREDGKIVVPEYQAKLNLAFMLGYQWLVWDTKTRQFRRSQTLSNDPNAPVRITVNKIGGLVERTIAKLVKNAPVPEARPVSDDEADVATARVGTRILSHEMDRLHWSTYLIDFLFWPITIGWAYTHVYWDPDQGDVVEEADEENEAVRVGQVCIETVPGLELLVDPNAKTMDDAKWCIRTNLMTPEGLWEQWGVNPPGDGDSSMKPLLTEVLSLSGQDTHNDRSSWVAVHQMWMKPCRAAPKGMVVTWTGTTILEDPKPFPYQHGKLPFVQMDALPGVSTREGRTWVTDLISLQADYNDARSREATIRRQLAPKVLAPVGSVDPTRFTSRVEVIPYLPTAGTPQMFMPDAGWMTQYEQGMSRADAEMGTRAGISEASQGQTNAGTPAAAILALQEADDTKLALTATALAGYTSRVGYQILMLTKQFWTEQRVVRTYSEEGSLDVARYTGADVGNGLDVHVSSESALPRSKSARVQLMLELHARGVIPDPQTLVRMLDLPGTDFIVKDMDLDMRRQHRELTRMLAGEDCAVEAWDNHSIHIAELNKFRKSVEYERLDDETRARIDAHAAVHEGLVLRQLGMPLTSPAPYDPNAAQGVAAVEGASSSSGYLMDPLTGAPPNPLAVASGQAPSPVTDEGIYNQAQIGQAAGQPGRVPGVPADNQAASMGA